MKAEFYIIPDSFAQNALMSNEEVEEKVKALSKDFKKIKEYPETNKIFIHEDIFNVVFIDKYTILDLLNYEKKASACLDRDARIALKHIVWEQETTDNTIEEVKEILLPEHDEDICCGLIAFNEVKDVNPLFQVVYNIQSWFTFRRHYLGVHPKNSDFYIEECKKYFPDIFFHERNKIVIKAILSDCPKKIIYHLAALNDNFRASQLSGLNRGDVLKHFSTNCSLDEEATLEGNASKKPKLTFEFLDKNGKTQKVCCEPHMKLCHSDTSTSYSNDRRMYFHEGKSDIYEGRFLMGHIGKHL